ncbi:chaperone modulator CbpM [Pontimicrobium sp. MEBiC01747]
MSTKNLISIKELCASHNIEQEYIISLEEFGFITIEKSEFIAFETLPKVEKIFRFHQEMNINFEGIDVILNLLERVENMSLEMNQLRNRLGLYED